MDHEFLKQRINVFCGTEIDPAIDSEVVDILKRKFNVYLPQRTSLDEALRATVSDHEIIGLILQYRNSPKT